MSTMSSKEVQIACMLIKRRHSNAKSVPSHTTINFSAKQVMTLVRYTKHLERLLKEHEISRTETTIEAVPRLSNVKINRRCRGGIEMEREGARKATSELNAGLGERFEPLLDYLYAKEMGGWGWGANYDDKFAGNMDGNTKWAALKGHYSMLLDLALDLIPPAYIKELQTNRVYRA